MQHTVIVGGRSIRYETRVSLRARHLRLSISEAGVVITLPQRMKPEMGERFLYQKADWVLRNLGRVEKNAARHRIPGGHLHFLRHKAVARRLVVELIEELQAIYHVPVQRVMVRDQKTRWGSCSRDGRLSFSYKILFLPPSAQRYIVAHELAHIKEFNHSKAFWVWVAKAIPDYKEQRKEMRKWSLR